MAALTGVGTVTRERVPEPFALPSPRGRRSWVLVLVGVVLAAVCASGAVALSRVGNRLVPVVGVAATVRFGDVIAETALVAVEIRPDPALRAVRWSDRSRLVGRTAATDLLVGSLVTDQVVSSEPLLPSGSQVVGVAVRTTQLPATAMRPRESVLLVPSAHVAGAVPEAWTPVRGMVLRVGERDAGGVRVVDVVVASTDGPELASRASTGQVAIVLLPQGGR